MDAAKGGVSIFMCLALCMCTYTCGRSSARSGIDHSKQYTFFDLSTKEREGFQKGEREGRADGEAEGFARGKTKGEEEGARNATEERDRQWRQALDRLPHDNKSADSSFRWYCTPDQLDQYLEKVVWK